MKKQIYKWIFFDLMGWKIVGGIESEVKKCVMMVMPHTSNHDFYLGVFTRMDHLKYTNKINVF